MKVKEFSSRIELLENIANKKEQDPNLQDLHKTEVIKPLL